MDRHTMYFTIVHSHLLKQLQHMFVLNALKPELLEFISTASQQKLTGLQVFLHSMDLLT